MHDSTTLHEKFDKLVQEDDELEGNMQMLTWCVPTWWNSDFDCLKAHIHFKSIIQSLTGVAANKLQAYQLNDSQWQLAEDLKLIFEVFNFLTFIPYYNWKSHGYKFLKVLLNFSQHQKCLWWWVWLIIVKLLLCEFYSICTVENMLLSRKGDKDCMIDIINIVVCARENCPIQIVLIWVVWKVYSWINGTDEGLDGIVITKHKPSIHSSSCIPNTTYMFDIPNTQF